jgi:hypothetical protein
VVVLLGLIELPDTMIVTDLAGLFLIVRYLKFGNVDGKCASLLKIVKLSD